MSLHIYACKLFSAIRNVFIRTILSTRNRKSLFQSKVRSFVQLCITRVQQDYTYTSILIYVQLNALYCKILNIRYQLPVNSGESDTFFSPLILILLHGRLDRGHPHQQLVDIRHIYIYTYTHTLEIMICCVTVEQLASASTENCFHIRIGGYTWS